jgi:hypothetical protein
VKGRRNPPTNPGALADPTDPRRKGLAVLEAEGDALQAALF